MILTQFKIFIRNFISKPLYPTICIIVLAVGITCLLLASVWVKDELNFDKSYTNSNRMYRLSMEVYDKSNGYHSHIARSWCSWLKNIKNDIPGIKDYTRFIYPGERIVKVDQKVFNSRVFRANEDFVRFFSIKFQEGNPVNALKEPNTAIITSSAAVKYFGNEEVLGKSFHYYDKNDAQGKDFKIIGIVKELPQNSHFHFDIVGSIDEKDQDNWFYNYLILDNHTNTTDILRNFRNCISKYEKPKDVPKYIPHITKVEDIHLTSSLGRELEENGSRKVVVILGILALFVFIVSILNFFNLQYIGFIKNQKNLLIMSYTGAEFRYFLFSQIPGLLFYAFIACLIGIVGFESLYGNFNTLLGKSADAGNVHIAGVFYRLIPAIIFIILLTGLIPIIILFIKRRAPKMLNSIKELSLHHLLKRTENRFNMLKVFITIQFVFSIILIITVTVVSRQVSYIMSARLGNQQNNIICVKELPVQVVDKYQLFKKELLSSPLIYDVTCTFEDPADDNLDMMSFETTVNKSKEKKVYVYPIDDNFFRFYNINLVAGRNFSKYIGNDSVKEEYILNETALKYLGWNAEEAIGQTFKLVLEFNGKNIFNGGTIVGVAKDFQMSSMKNEIKPYVFFQKSYWLFSAQIKYDSARYAQSLELINKTWKKYYPDFPLQYQFVEDLYAQKYKNEIQLKKLSFILGVIALILSSLGLIGITGIIYETKTKEIGIRKVNGARINQIIKWLVKDIFFIVIIALIIAIPVGYYMMKIWLQNFAYKTSIEWWIFGLSGAFVLIVALITVSWQSWRAASKNPVEALRYE